MAQITSARNGFTSTVSQSMPRSEQVSAVVPEPPVGSIAWATETPIPSRISASTAGLETLKDEQAEIALLRGEPLPLRAALRAADRHAAQPSPDCREIYLASVAGLAGGFFAGFASLRAGLLSNAGTATVVLAC